ncbi:glutaredoxin 2 [Pseudomonas monteilii]|uniref:glutaredoxin 2 n=1 Tax=Pseudomonas monteilii TaxID=76759 RepID=UPI0038069CD8
MKLYIYEHCPFCTRARMIFGLKSLPVDLQVIMEGDVETPTRLIGKKAVPILGKDDGTYIGESLDIVRYVDDIGAKILVMPPDEALDTWVQEIWPTALKLFIPRFVEGDFAELAMSQARKAYRHREEQAFGGLDLLRGATTALIAEVNPRLEALATLLEDRKGLGINDITLWPVLRCLSIVRDVNFPNKVSSYMHRLSQESGVDLLFAQSR